MEYQRELEWNEPPSLSERRYARWAVVRAAGPPAASWWPLARIGAVDLYLAPPGRAQDAPAISTTPLLASKRGRRGSGDYAGVDGQVQTDAFDVDASAAAGPAPARPTPPPPAPTRTDAVRVAIIDIAFDRLGALPAPAEGPISVGLPADDAPSTIASTIGSWGPGHGTAMAGIVQVQCPGAHVGLFQIPSSAGAARPYLAGADLAAAVAAAVGAWQADVVVLAMSDGAWGTPPYLRDVLREAARCGRGGRGTPIFCSVGDPSRNHSRDDDSVSLGADDLASQPWVHAIAACDARGRWYRVYPGYDCAGSAPANGNGGDAPGATYNRLGPAVAFSAPGAPTRWSEHIAADDSSQATAVAAAAAARTLGENPDLTAAELRALLALTADSPAVVDGGRGLAAGSFDGRDRLGHNFKIGHGAVNAEAACLAAADPVCLALLATRPVPEVARESHALALARAWRRQLQEARGAGDPLADAYAQVGRRVSRLFLTALPVQEALCWLARHVRALSDTGRVDHWRRQHHGALVERIRHALDTVTDALGADDRGHRAVLERFEAACAGPAGGAAVGNALARLLGPDVMAADGEQGGARSIALTGDAVGDRSRGRGPQRADGGGEPERVPFARSAVPGSVH